MKLGIALAGGGCRGAAHAGVLLALEENGIFPSSAAGTSAGSIVAGLYAAGYSGAQLKDIVMRLSLRNPELMDFSIISMIAALPQLISKHRLNLSGLIKGNRIESMLCSLTGGKNISDITMPLVIPAVDLISGLTVSFSNRKPLTYTENVRWSDHAGLCAAIRASIAVPAIFQPKRIGDMCLVDGGITNVLPVDLLAAVGEKNILAIDLSNKYTMPKRFSMIEVTAASYNIMRNYLRDKTSTGERLLLNPPIPHDIGILDFHRMSECMDIGYEYTMENMSLIKYLFGSKSA